ncbi:MAG: hypothetical protein ACREOO_31440 [bacterium]
MFEIEIAPHDDGERHRCEAYREGDWIIFRCALCQDFERRYNWRTGVMKSRSTRTGILHAGNYFPQEFGSAYTDTN